jgi:hypothetical protein
MPKTINWETQVISFYKFVCKNPDILFSYVGHTISFRQRKWSHKSACNNPNCKDHNIPLYKFIREHGGFENWNMIVIHTQICKDKRDAERIEHELIEQQQFKLNSNRAFITEEQKSTYVAEYYQKNKERIAIRDAKFREKNKEQIKIERAEYYEKNRDILNAKQRAKRALLKAQLNCEILDVANP